jgi:hypothetical protein
MGMERRLEPELLDELPPADPGAVRSRKDLQRVNAWMGNASSMARALRSALGERQLLSVVELGGGDGTFLLRVGQHLRENWHDVSATVLDKQNLLAKETIQAFEKIGWRVEALTSDIFDWLRQPGSARAQVMLANLFLHHFSEAQLAQLFQHAKKRTELFIAIEPARSALPLVFSRLLWAIGCNRVTRHDAVVSVRAGFRSQELSRLWGEDKDWLLHEHSAGLFGQLFIAKRIGSPALSGYGAREAAPHARNLLTK